VTGGTCVISVSIFISAVKYFFFLRNNIGHLSRIINAKQSRGSSTVVKTRKYNMMMTGEINRSRRIFKDVQCCILMFVDAPEAFTY